MNERNALIEVKGLKKYFDINVGMFKTKHLKAVDNVSFSIMKGETFGLVGESGCGKTTVGRTILNLYKPTAGEIRYNTKLIKSKADIKEFHKKATMVFQDPYSSLNPRMTVSDIIGEPLDVHKLYSDKKEREEKMAQLQLQLLDPALASDYGKLMEIQEAIDKEEHQQETLLERMLEAETELEELSNA